MKVRKNKNNEEMDPQDTTQETESVEKTTAEQDEISELRQQLEESQTQSEEFKDGWQRARAEFDNYRKRIERENALVYQNAVGNVIKRYLPVMDDLERALQARPDDIPWADGIELIYRKLQSILDSEGIKRIEAKGQVFDPNLHEAIGQEPSEDVPCGHVIDIIQNGYILGEKVLRPALVRVAA